MGFLSDDGARQPPLLKGVRRTGRHRSKEIDMFRKLFALEVAALTANDESTDRAERTEAEILANIREMFTPRSGNYGSMWSTRSFS